MHRPACSWRTTALAIVAVLLLVVGCDARPAVPVPSVPGVADVGRLLWVGDVETGDLSQFQDAPWNNVAGEPPQVVEDPVNHGLHALRVGIQGTSDAADGICCGSRDEILPKFRDIVPGDDLYFAFSTYLAPNFPVDDDWQVIVQFKQNFDGSPPLSLNVEHGQYKIEGGYGHPAGPREFMKPVGAAITGTWVAWLLHVRFSADPTVGFVEVWQNGALVLPRFAPPGGTMYPGPGGVDASYVKFGYYRNPLIDRPGVIYFDDWAIGTAPEMVQH